MIAHTIGALALETGLSERCGFEWVHRPKSRGRVIKGVQDRLITAFSSRRAQIDKVTLGLVERFTEERGAEPDRRAVWSMSRYAHNLTKRSKPEGALDYERLLGDWERTSREAESGSLTELAQGIWGGAAQAERRLKRTGEMTLEEERRLMTAALADAQQSQAVFGRHVLIHRLGENMPDHVLAHGYDHAREMLDGLADRILAGEGGDVVHCVTAGEFPRVPDYLRRASGESVFKAPGSRLYATESQLSLEQRIIARAQAEAGPRLSPEKSAELLGGDLADLEAQLWGAAQTSDAITGSTLRLDQAAVVHHMVTSRRRAEVGVALAGAGKTYMAGRAADVWSAAKLGRVIGVTLSSAARDELGAASPHIEKYNSAELFGDLPGERGARGHVPIGRNALIIVDEAGVEDLQRFGEILRLAEQTDSKVLFLGDTHQLTSPESGGGLSMLARKLGHAQVQEAIRFHDQWQRDASVALRAGDLQALAEYDVHGRLHAGTFEQMAESAARAYAVDRMDGKDSMLLANSNEEARELSRRVQGYMREWGKLGAASVPLRENQRVHVGDRIIARHNDDRVLNGDVLTVTGFSERGLVADRNGEQVDLAADYLLKHVDLGYSRTWMTSQGKTVADSAHSLVPSSANRNGLYESMTRSRLENHGYFYEADPECPPVHDEPEVERTRLRQAERRGQVVERAETADAVTLAARVVARLDEPLSATEVRERSFSNADSLAVLWPKWMDQVKADGGQRYAQIVREQLGGKADQVLQDSTDDLYRALRHAELAGQDASQVIREAVTRRGFDGARSMSAVLASRVREATEAMPALPRDSWLEKVPMCSDKDRQDFLVRLAKAMDGRQDRLGAHVAETQPVWAREALGELPEAGPAREAWLASAGKIEAAREILGWDHEGRALGAIPGTHSPEFRAEWQNALGAMAKVDGVDVRGLTDGLLLVRRVAFERETSWAPADVSEELRVLRLTQTSARIEARRCEQDAAAARRDGREAWASLHDARRSDRMAVDEKCALLVAELEPADQTRREWETITADTRRVALAADLELKRRGVLDPDEQMKSGEPDGLVPGDMAAEDRDAVIRDALGIESADSETTAKVAELTERSRETQARIDQIRSTPEPEADEDLEMSEAWGTLLGRERDAILVPPVALLSPAPEVEADRESDREMAE